MSKQAEEICAGVQNLNAETTELAEQVLFMRKKLESERIRLKNVPLTIEYDNGGGQSGIRENPDIIAYEKLLSSYMKALKQLQDIIENHKAPEKTSNLMDFRTKLKVVGK